MNSKPRIILSILIVVSILVCLFSAALQAGYEHPNQISDSKGNQLGFNNALTWELCGILLRSASPKTIAQTLGYYGGIYLIAHFLALYLLVTNSSKLAKRATTNWFWFQFIIFPLSWFGILMLPAFIRSFVKGQIDGETISEFPFWWTFQPLWFVISLTAGILIWRNTMKVSLPEAKSPVIPGIRGS